MSPGALLEIAMPMLSNESSASTRHPLDPLTQTEIQIAARAIKLYALQSEYRIRAFKFITITLKEPDKLLVLRALGIPLEPLEFGKSAPERSHEAIPREVYALVLDTMNGRSYEVKVLLGQGGEQDDAGSGEAKITSFVQMEEGVQPSISVGELLEAEPLVKADPTVQKLCQELGLTMDQVYCDGWSIGSDERYPNSMRIQQCMMFARPYGPDSNLYAHPLDFIPILDLTAQKVIRIDWPTPRLEGVKTTTEPTRLSDTSEPTWKRTGYPDTPSEYLPEYLEKTEGFKLRQDLKPIHISQPQGVSFTLEGNRLRWQKYDMHIGFNYREGLVINTLTYTDTDLGKDIPATVRPLFYRMSIAEMVVPYGDPGWPHHRKMAFDAGEYGLGMMVNSLNLGCDCKGAITYLDAHLPTHDGEGLIIKNAICIHEEDAGLSWKHTDYRTGRAHAVRMRKLVVSCVCTLANYEYGFYFNFFQDGSVQCEIKLTGVLHTVHLGEGEKPGQFGIEVAPRVNAQFHQHIFCLRVDPMVDGLKNSVVQSDYKRLEDPKGSATNYLGNGWTNEKTVLKSAQGVDYNLDTARNWTIVNPSRKHYCSDLPAGYKISCKDFAPLLSSASSIVAQRAPFAQHHLHVVPYADDKLYPSGWHLPQVNEARDGINSWVAKQGSTEDTDLVTYITFTANHVPRPEDFPVMPVEIVGVFFKPSSFFKRNPALDVPQEMDTRSVHATAYTEERVEGTGTGEVRVNGISSFKKLFQPNLSELLKCSSPNAHKDAIWSCQWTAKNRVVTASADGSIVEWDATTGEQTKALPPHTLGIVSLSVPPIGEYALYNTLEGLTGLWNLGNGEVVGKWESYKRKNETEPAWQVSLHPNNRTYCSTGGTGEVALHTALAEDGTAAEFGTPVGKMSAGKSKFGMCLKHSQDGNRIAMSTEAGAVSVFDLQSTSLITTFQSHAMCVRTLCWSPDGNLLVSGSDDRRLTIYDVRTSKSSKLGGAVAHLTGHASWVVSSSISPDSRYLISGSSDKSVRIYDLTQPKQSSAVFTTSPGAGDVWAVSWKPIPSAGSGGMFVTGGEDGVARFWRAAGAS